AGLCVFPFALLAAERNFGRADLNRVVLAHWLASNRAGNLHDLSGLEQLAFDLQIKLLRIRLERLGAVIATEVNLVAVLRLDDVALAGWLSGDGARGFK